jgi:hypothetical protein
VRKELTLGAFAVAGMLAGGCSAPAPAGRPTAAPSNSAPADSPYGAEFRRLWPDRQPEISTYDVVTKSGDKGTVTVVFVATQFSRSAQVEADPVRHRGSDLFPAMKLNVLRRTAAASDMVTVFTSLADVDGLPAGMAKQVTFSSQSLSGQSWEKMTIRTSGILARIYNSSRGESQRSLEYQNGTLPADALPLVARRFAWPRLRLGQTYGVRLLSELRDTTPLEASQATLFMGQERQTATVPAGTFRVRVFRASDRNQPSRTWYVEADPPFRIVRWEFGGERAELVSSGRKPDR